MTQKTTSSKQRRAGKKRVGTEANEQTATHWWGSQTYSSGGSARRGYDDGRCAADVQRGRQHRRLEAAVAAAATGPL